MIKKIAFDGNIVYIFDDVLFIDVMPMFKAYSDFISLNKEIVLIDFQYVEKSNTSILLLMINFLKLAIKKRCDIMFIHVPDFLIELGRVYNLNSILYNKKNWRRHVKRKN